MFYRFIVFIVRIAMHIWYDLRFEGRENCPKKGGYVYASNHRSYVDPVVVVLGGHGKFNFMAKTELFEGNKLFCWLIKALGAFPVERGKGDSAAIDTAIDKIKSGHNLLIFPEGTRSRTGKVGRGKTGVALIAAMAGVDVIPVGINFEGEKLHFRSKIIVRFGPAIPASQLELPAEPNPRDLRSLKNSIMDGVRALVDEPEEVPKLTENQEETA
ncbi:MAG: 1-acyl-sn-glycerol-3-phosphate acyltransferase [Oscillospiraceae bacterium]|nr:1-acyl-sn-glycerol-3-phosphate acyltransferase [Oscillospiraceae bacterium]